MVGVGAGLLVLILMKAHYHNFVLYHINKSQCHLFDHQSPPTIPQPQILQHRRAAQDAKDKKATKSLVHREKFKDFSQNAYTLVISRCQQLALSKAGNKLPTPAEQLELINKRREKKKARVASANLWWESGMNVVVIPSLFLSLQPKGRSRYGMYLSSYLISWLSKSSWGN